MKTNSTFPRVVIDSSAILNLLFPDENLSPEHQTIFDQFLSNSLLFIAPGLLKTEITNALKSGVKRQRITPEVALQIFEKFLQLPIEYQDESHLQSLKIAIHYQINVYDAVYLQMSIRFKVALVSTDKRLVEIAQKLARK